MAVTFQFNANAQQAIREIEKLVAENAKLRAEMQKAGEQSKRNQKEHSAFASSVTGELKGMLLQYASIGAAVGFVVKAYADWRRETDQLGEAHKKFTANLVKELATTTDLAEGARVSQRIASFQATREQSLELLAGIREGTPATSLDRRLALAEAAAPLAATNIDMRQFGTAVGEFQDFAPGKEAGDVVDLAKMVQARAGGDFAKTFSPEVLRGLGVLVQEKQVGSLEEGIGTVLAALDANVSAKILPMLTEPGKLKGAQRKFAQLIPKEAIEARTAELFAAQREDFRLQQIEQLGGFQEGRLQMQEQEGAVRLERAAETRARVEQAADQVEREMQARAEEAGIGWFGRAATKPFTWLARQFAQDAVVKELQEIKHNQRPVNINGHNE